MSRHPALVGLPDALLDLVPELGRAALPAETRADCSRCVVAGGTALEDRAPFVRDDLRCCTFQPRLPNYLVGQGLLAGGESEERLRAVLAGDSVRTWTFLDRPPGWVERFERMGREGFGREPAMRCPFYAPGTGSCTIWASRGTGCRVFHCRYVHGASGWTLWSAVRRLLAAAEVRLAEVAASDATGPAAADGVEAWVDWYVACAERVRRWSADPAGRDPELLALQAELASARAGLSDPGPVPEVVHPSVGDVTRLDDGSVLLSGYSYRDFVRVDGRIFALLAGLDGERPWREVLSEVRSQGARDVDEGVVQRLWDVGALSTS